MNNKKSVFNSQLILSALLTAMISSPAMAVEEIIKEELVMVAKNAIFMIDTSSSMDEEFRDTNSSKRTLVEEVFQERNGTFPDIGHNFGIYTYTRWEEFYPLQPFNRSEVVKALNEVAKKGPGPTPLRDGLESLEKVLQSASGKTAVFVFSDGE
ncbi:MAG: vWA domain-containing protein, partial [Gammaproteobacteria bacterium]